jgi:membrane protease subunit HflK
LRRFLLALALIAFAVASLLTAVTQVQPGERAVVRRFGRVLEHKPGPGLFVGLPWGLDRVDRVKVKGSRLVRVGYVPGAEDESGMTPPGQMVTGDHNLINLQVTVEYVVNEDEVERFVLQADRADALVERAAETALVEWAAGQTVDGLVTADRNELQDWLVRQTQARLEPYRLGVLIKGATLAPPVPPQEVKDAFAAVAQAETMRETAITRARQEANQQLRQTEAEVYRMQKLTSAYVHDQRLRAEADAGNYLKQLEQYRRLSKENPAYLAGLWWDEMGRLYARMRANGRLDLLDNHLGKDGLDITQMQPPPKKR